MKGRVAAAAIVIAAASAWVLWPKSDVSDSQASTTKKRPPPSEPRTPGCRVTGRVVGAEILRVVVRSELHGIDLEAELTDDTFTAHVPKSGPVAIVGVSSSGQTVSVHEPCRLGRAHALLRFSPPPKNAAQLAGRCLYLDTGAPVPAATVTARFGAPMTDAVGVVTRSTLSGDEGRFTLALKPGAYRVQCAKDRDESEPAHVSLGVSGKVQLPTLYVEPTAGVTGIVVDESQVPVPDVAVTARSVRREDQARSATSDNQGRFFIEGLLPGTVSVEAQSRLGSAEAEAQAQVSLPYAEVELRLQKGHGSKLWGTVVNERSEPIAGAWIKVRDANGKRRRGRSEADGSFAVAGLQPGTASVEVVKNEESSTSRINVKAGENQVQLVLRPRCEALIEITGAPAGSSVELQVRNRQRTGSRISGPADSPLRLKVPSGVHELHARLSGSVVRTTSVTKDLCSTPTTINFPPAEGARLDVLTVDEESQPVGGVQVRLLGPKRLSSSTNDQGKVAFLDLPAGSYEVQARGGEPQSVDLADSPESVTLTVPRREGVIEGIVRSANGPVEGARVLAACADGGRLLSLRDAPMRARSEADGRFSFTPDDGGICRVRAEHATEGRSHDLTLTVGGSPAELRLQSGATLAGTVRHADGQPVSSYQITVDPSLAERERRSVQVTDADGRYHLKDLLPGPVTVRVNGDAGKASKQTVLQENTDSTLDITLVRFGKVSGRVVSDGQPVPGVSVRFRTSRGRAAGVASTKADGRFSANIPPGDTVQAFLQAEGYYPTGTPGFNLGDDGTTDLGDLILEPRGTDEEKEGGIGLAFGGAERGIRVLRFTEDSPGREAGLEVGDTIVSIDGVPFGGEPLINWVVRLRGLPGTTVTLGVVRGDRGPFPVPVVRRVIGLAPVGR